MVMYSVNRCPKENDCDVIKVMPAIALSIISKENKSPQLLKQVMFPKQLNASNKSH